MGPAGVAVTTAATTKYRALASKASHDRSGPTDQAIDSPTQSVNTANAARPTRAARPSAKRRGASHTQAMASGISMNTTGAVREKI